MLPAVERGEYGKWDAGRFDTLCTPETWVGGRRPAPLAEALSLVPSLVNAIPCDVPRTISMRSDSRRYTGYIMLIYYRSSFALGEELEFLSGEWRG